MKKIQWETLVDDEDYSTKRLKVPGGWLVRYSESFINDEGKVPVASLSNSICFYEDPLHEWLKNDP